MVTSPRKHVSSAALALIRISEIFKPTTYLCPAGKLTIGYGHVVRPGEDFSRGISKERAEALMVEDLAPAEIYLHAVLPGLTQNEFDALASFCFNVGLYHFENSTLFARLQAGDEAGAAAQFERWVFGGEPKRRLPGLITRRAAERDLFLMPKAQPWTP